MFLLFVFQKFLMILYLLVLYPKKGYDLVFCLFFNARKDISVWYWNYYIVLVSTCQSVPWTTMSKVLYVDADICYVFTGTLTLINKTKQIVLCFL